MNGADYILRLNEIAEKKLAAYRELLNICLELKKQNRAPGSESEVKLAGRGQELWDSTEQLDKQFLVYASRLKSTLAIHSFEELPALKLEGTAALKGLINEINGLHRNIEEIWGVGNKSAEAAQNETRTLEAKQVVRPAYRPQGTASFSSFSKNKTPTGRFDKKS